MTKEKAILEYIVRWLDSNIDEPPPEGVQEDSANLKEKIELAWIHRPRLKILKVVIFDH